MKGCHKCPLPQSSLTSVKKYWDFRRSNTTPTAGNTDVIAHSGLAVTLLEHFQLANGSSGGMNRWHFPYPYLSFCAADTTLSVSEPSTA